MKFNRVFSILAALFFIAITANSVSAQDPQSILQYNDPCSACAPSINGISIVTLNPCGVMGFGASAGFNGHGDCDVLRYTWATNDPDNCDVDPLDPDSQHVKITFAKNGTYTVCVRVTSWWDANDNKIVDMGETCTSDMYCEQVVISCHPE